MRKRRADAVLHNLPEPTQREIYRLETEERLTLEEIQSRLAMPEDEGGIGVGHVSIGAISGFLRHWRSMQWRDRLRAAATTAQEAVDDGIGESGEVMDEAILAGIREWIVDTLARGQMDAKDAKSLVGLVLKGRQQSLEARKIEILEKKAAAYDKAAETAEDDNLTAEERLAKIREGLRI